MVIAAALCQACRGPTQQAEAEARDRAKVAAADIAPKPYSIQPGDTIEVKFAFNPDFDNQLPVRPDGRFALPLVGDIEAVGSTPDELRARLETVYVGGEVRDPSILKLDVRTTALRAIMAAGGGLTTGDLRKVVIVRDRGTPEPEILMLDLSKGLETLASAEDLWLQPRDMVFVPRTGISKANQFVREYIRDMLPIQSSFNLQYQFTEVATGGF
jgi:protein involved in polysaccharide export with SLBB domain